MVDQLPKLPVWAVEAGDRNISSAMHVGDLELGWAGVDRGRRSDCSL